jgi:DNA-binding response OmpR family regulator
MNRGNRLLIVEDEPLSRDVLTRMLVSRGFEVDSVESGPTCLEWLERHDPELILLDVSMPGMSGLDVLRAIRERRSSHELPVVLVSALIDSEDVVAGLEAGANDYVLKPVNLPILLARINVCLNMRQSVERLIDAERHRVMLESLGTACDHLAQPVTEVIGSLDELAGRLDDTDVEVIRRLEEVRNWARRAGELLESFRKVARYRQEPYTEGLGGFVTAALEQATKTGE